MDVQNFHRLVADIVLPEVIVPAPWYRKPIASLEDYRLVPVWGEKIRRGRGPRSIDLAEYNNRTVDGVIIEYWETDQPKPYSRCHINTRRGILLTKDNRAIAVTSAGINPSLPEDEPAELMIPQMQGLIKNDRQPELAPALRAGFLWRETFVSAWENIARKIPAIGRVAIFPASELAVPDDLAEHFYQGYDGVASRMHYDPDEARGLWVKNL